MPRGWIALVAIGVVPYALALAANVSWTVVIILYAIVALPAYEEFSLRRLEKLSKRPPAELLSLNRNRTSPWYAINGATISGNILNVKGVTLGRVLLDAPTMERTLETFRSKLGARVAVKPVSSPFLLRATTLAIACVFVSGSLVMVAAAVLPFLSGEQSNYASVLQSTTASLAGASPQKAFVLLFLNNIRVALGVGYPFLGLFSLGGSGYETGRVIQVLALQHSVSPYALLAAIYSLPHAWVEEVTYALAAWSGLYLYVKWYSGPSQTLPEALRDRGARPAVQFSLTYAKLSLMIAAAAALETIEPYLSVLAYALWIPVLAVFSWYLWRRSSLPGRMRPGQRLTLDMRRIKTIAAVAIVATVLVLAGGLAAASLTIIPSSTSGTGTGSTTVGTTGIVSTSATTSSSTLLQTTAVFSSTACPDPTGHMSATQLTVGDP